MVELREENFNEGERREESNEKRTRDHGIRSNWGSNANYEHHNIEKYLGREKKNTKRR